MFIAVRVLIVLLGLMFLFVGASFLFDPVGMGGNFGLEAKGAHGLASIRADLTGFFWVAGGCALIGVWKQRGELLLVTAAFMGIAVSARALSLALDGTFDGFLPPMVVEAVTLILCVIGARMMSGARALPGEHSEPKPV
ncbi:MAG: DUF4345 family protein [Pseudomonadota bacterium]